MRKNRNRGYQQLRVWQEAVEHYAETCRIFRSFPSDLRRVSAQAIASSDSVHRNIAEGYCRRSRKEYLNFLNYALGSLGECVSGQFAYKMANQLTSADFERLDEMSFKLENGLLRLVDSLKEPREESGWDDAAVVREANAVYGGA